MKFDIDTYKEKASRLEFADIDFESFKDQPLDQASLRCLRYMHDVELHTVCYLRDLLVTPAHRDPTITTFLTFWLYEEYWHGEAICNVLEAHGELAGDERVGLVRGTLGMKDRIQPLIHNVAGWFIGDDFPALHMAWGAINEWVTQASYARLIAQANNRTLTDLLKRIMKQEGRHIDFYATQARERLESSKRARRITRYALRKFWEPVGSTIMPLNEVNHLATYLFADSDGRTAASRIDRHIDRLPGLGNLHLVNNAIDKFAA